MMTKLVQLDRLLSYLRLGRLFQTWQDILKKMRMNSLYPF